MPKFDTLIDIFDHALKYHPEGTQFFAKDKNKNFRASSFRQVYHDAENLALSLIAAGVKKGDNVAIMADNSTEWITTDIACLISGAANVPRGSDSTVDEIKYILDHSDSEVCFVHDATLLKKIEPILEETKVKTIIVLDPNYSNADGTIKTVAQLVKAGEQLRSQGLAELNNRRKAITKDDLFTIIYTSGTTGAPKGVMLTHGNIAYNIEVVPSMVGIQVGDRALSILPIWHIFERAVEYAMIPFGCKIYYTNIRDLRDDFLKCRPTFMASAPRLWENIFNGLTQRVEKETPVKQFLFNSALEVNRYWRRSMDYLQGNTLQVKKESDIENAALTAVSVFGSVNLLLLAKALDTLVFAKVREALGGELRGTMSGGGALPAHVDEFFNAIGIPVYEGYGMTECAPIISARTVGNIVQGSVGFIPAGTRVKLLDDTGKEVATGEKGIIFVKGPQVMNGYYKNQEATDKVLKDGWLNTGDIGVFSYNGTLSIRGRAKDTIVLLGGENLEPVPIENLLQENDFIDQIMVVGQDKKTLGALVWPNKEKLKEAEIHFSENEDLNKNAAAKKFYQSIIKKAVSAENGFKSFERISDFRFLPKAFEVGDELTQLFKMKRNVIADKYESLIEEMY